MKTVIFEPMDSSTFLISKRKKHIALLGIHRRNLLSMYTSSNVIKPFATPNKQGMKTSMRKRQAGNKNAELQSNTLAF